MQKMDIYLGCILVYCMLGAQQHTIHSIHVAAMIGENDIIEEHIKRGVSINLPDYKGMTPLHHAADFNQYACVEFLIKHGAKVQVKNHDGLTPYQVAKATWASGALLTLLEKAERSQEATD